MALEGTLGGPRDIMALRAGNAQLAAAIDAMVELATTFAASWAGFSAADYQELGGGDLSADDAYWQANQIQDIPGYLASADVQALVDYAARTRDVTR